MGGWRFLVSATPAPRRYILPASVSTHPPAVWGMKRSRKIASDRVPVYTATRMNRARCRDFEFLYAALSNRATSSWVSQRSRGAGRAGMYDRGQGVPEDDAEAVRLYRLAAEHRGVPLAFVPFVATRQGALEAVDDGPLFGEVLSHVGRAFKALKDAERHNPR